jgi:hypothetical protein
VSCAVDALLDRHFQAEEIHVVVSTSGEERRVPVETHPRMIELAGRWGAVGAVTGAIAATAAVLAAPDAAFVVQVLSPSAVVAAIQGLLAGGFFSALSGLIIGLVSWRAETKLDDVDFAEAVVSVGVDARGARATEAAGALEGAGATEISGRE